MFEGPGTTMTEVNTQFSLMTALFVARNVLYFEFPAFFHNFCEIQDEKKIGDFFPRNRENSHRPIFGERAKESGYCDVNRTDLGR